LSMKGLLFEKGIG